MEKKLQQLPKMQLLVTTHLRVSYTFMLNKAPGKPLSPLESEFIRMVLSTQGQKVVVKDGYIPLPSKVADKALASIDVEKNAMKVSAAE